MASRSVLAPALDLTLALSGPQRGDEEQEREQEGGASHPRCIHVGSRVRGAAGTPRKRLEGAFGTRFRLRCLAGAGRREEWDWSAICCQAIMILVRLPSDGKRRCANCHSLCLEPIFDAHWYDGGDSRMEETRSKELQLQLEWLQLHRSFCHP